MIRSNSASTWTCDRCGEVFHRWEPAERHVNEAHHGGRIAVDVPVRGGSR